MSFYFWVASFLAIWIANLFESLVTRTQFEIRKTIQKPFIVTMDNLLGETFARFRKAVCHCLFCESKCVSRSERDVSVELPSLCLLWSSQFQHFTTDKQCT